MNSSFRININNITEDNNSIHKMEIKSNISNINVIVLGESSKFPSN